MPKTRRKQHSRKTKRGRTTVREHDMQVPAKIRRQVINTEMSRLVKELKQKGRTRVDNLGILRLKKIPPSPGGKKVVAFGKEFITKPKPARVKFKFRPTKALKEAM